MLMHKILKKSVVKLNVLLLTFSAIAINTMVTMSVAQAGVKSLALKEAQIKQAETEIHKIITLFDQSIVKKDKETFLELFIDPNTRWVDVLSDATINEVKHKRTDIKKINYGNPIEFIDSIVNDKFAIKETFDNIQINTDGDVASVTFDYALYEDDFKNNWGKESWQLARTENGWKIATIVFSVTLNPKRHQRKKQ